MEQARQNLEAQVLERAAKDPQFREQLKQDPRGTVSREFRVRVPQDITVEVVEETASTVYLILPPASAGPSQQLSDQELEAVAGGWSEDTGCGYTCNEVTCRGSICVPDCG